MDQMTYHKFMNDYHNDYHEAMTSPPQSSKPTTSPHESNKSEPMVKKKSEPVVKKGAKYTFFVSFKQRKKMKE
eukprot:4120363-Prymnesium_polylepis.1